jgi:predicted DNA-binding protein
MADPQITVAVRMPRSVKNRLNKISELRGMKIAGLTTQLLREGLDRLTNLTTADIVTNSSQALPPTNKQPSISKRTSKSKVVKLILPVPSQAPSMPPHLGAGTSATTQL